MPSRQPIPHGLAGQAVTPHDLRAKGMEPKMLRGQRFAPRSRGLFYPAGWEPSLVDDCQSMLRLMPKGSVVGHVTAASLWGMPLPPRMDEHLHTVIAAGEQPPRRKGVVGHCMELPPEHVAEFDGLPVTTPERTLLDLAPDLRLHELVAAGDAALRVAHLNRETTRALVKWAKGRRGVVRLRRAEPMLDARAESAPESHVRVWCSVSGLPFFEPNVEIWDDAVLVARVDLYCDEYRLAIEYEGAYHRTREQYASDIRRRARLTALGIEVLQIEATMMHAPRALVIHVGQALRRRGWTGSPRTGSLIE